MTPGMLLLARRFFGFKLKNAIASGTVTPFKLPNTAEGAPLPLLYGTVRVEHPALIWWGNTQYAYHAFGGQWTYSVDLIYALGVPAYGVTSSMIGARWGDKIVDNFASNGATITFGNVNSIINSIGLARWTMVDTQAMPFIVHLHTVTSSDPSLTSASFVAGVMQFYGGSPSQKVTAFPNSPPAAPGGSPIAGIVDVGLGSQNQSAITTTPGTYQLIDNMFSFAASNNSAGVIPDRSLCSGFRNQILVAVRIFSMPDSSLPSLTFDIASPGPKPVFVQTGTDANPAMVLLDLLTGSVFKIGIPTSFVDVTSFNNCAATLSSEGNGCSIAIDSLTDVGSAIDTILRQINGDLYQSTATGLITLRLIRNDYGSISTLPQITQNNVIGKLDYATSTPRESYNEIRATYTDRAQNYQQGVVLGQALGMLISQDARPRQMTVDYPHVKSLNLAAQLAARDLNAATRPLATMKCDVQRSFYNLSPSDAVAVTFPQYNVTQKVMRVQSIDHGQLADGKIHLELVEDVFTNTAGALGGHSWTVNIPTVMPLTKRLFMEAPRWWTAQAIATGGKAAQALQVPEMPTSFAVAKPDDSANLFAVQTRVLSLLNNISVNGAISASPDYPATQNTAGQFSTDIASHAFPPAYTLAQAYSRTNEPYDTTSNQLIIQGGPTSLTSLLYGVDLSQQTWATDGSTMLLIVEASGAYEFVLFETVTNLGNGQYRLNNVWRGLLDTPASAHAAGAIAYIINTSASVGTVAYSYGKTVQGQALPRLVPAVGSGHDPIDSYVVAARAFSPYPPSDMRVGSDYPNLVGTSGIPADGSHYKSITRLEEGFDIYGRFRDRRKSQAVTRGDLAPEVVSDDNVAALVAVVQVGDSFTSPLHQFYAPFNPGLTSALQNQSNAQAIGAGGSVPGYGNFDICLYTKKTIGAGDLANTLLGIPQNTVLNSLIAARVTAFLPSWRNQLMNARWNYYNGTTSPSDQGWDNEVGTAGTATFFTTGIGTAPNAIGTTSSQLVRGQRAELTSFNNSTGAFIGGPQSFLPRGLWALVCGYFYDAAASADTATLKIEALDKNGGSLSNNSATFTPPNSNFWGYHEVLLGQMPATAQYARATITLNKTSGSGSINTENALYVGQFASNTARLLANDSFESGMTSWTTDTGTVATATGGSSQLSTTVASMTGTTAAQIHQDFTLPTGYEYSTAVLRVWFKQTISGNNPNATLQVLDGSNTVLASATLNSPAMPALNAWYKQTLNVDTVDGAVKIRVILAGGYASGGSVGVQVDEVGFMLHKRLDASYSMSLAFDTPTYQPMPTTWQDYHVAYPSMPLPTVYSGNPNDGWAEWSDGGTRAAASLVGLFGSSSGSFTTSVSAYPLTRTGPISAIYVQPLGASNLQNTQFAAYSASQSFTALVYFRVDEPGFNTFCGLVGRMNASRGWGVNITAAGQLQALLRGNFNTSAAIATGRTVTEGALHMAALVYNAATQTLSIYDEQGLGGSVSTATIQDFASLPADTDAFFRIGTDAPDHQTLPGQIGPIYLWAQALSTSQIAQHWNYCKDPSAQLTTYTRTAAAIVPIGPDGNGNAQACVMSAAQVALAYNSVLTNDNGNAFVVTAQGTGWQTTNGGVTPQNGYTATGYGLAIGKATTNLIPDALFTGANWTKDANTTVATGQTDPTGRPRGALVGVDTANGLIVSNLTLAASPANVTFVFWAMSAPTSGITSLSIQLQNANGAIKNTQSVTLTSLWQKFTVTFASWDGSTPTGRLRFLSGSGQGSFVLAGVMCAAQGTDVPAILPLPGQTHGNYNAQIATSLPKQFNYEGECICEGVAMIAAPTVTGTLVQATIGTTANQRELQVNSGLAGFNHLHYDSASALTTASVAYSTLATHVWRARMRWAQVGMLDNVSPQDFSAVAVSDETSSSATPTIGTGRTASWTITATSLTTVNIGSGTASPSDVLLRKIILRSREEKLI